MTLKRGQLAQDDDGFEIRSLADSIDEEDARSVDGQRTPVPNGAASGQSPMPPKPAASAFVPSPRLRESLDGETIFAVGEDAEDKWSDDDDELARDSGERKRLTGKDS